MHYSTILIVDDNPANIKMLGNLLKSNNYNAEFALNGKSAVEWIMKKDFDLILLDVMMPEMDGYEVATILKNTPEKRDIPIIFLTAKNDEESILKGFESGGIDFLTKPFNHAELLARVATHIELKNAKATIGFQNLRIEKSLAYTKLIENVLSQSKTFETFFPKGFVFSAFSNITSNNFYSIKEKKELLIFLVSNYLGNNVSATLINLLLVSILNELLLEHDCFDAGEIARALHSKIQLLYDKDKNDIENELGVNFFVLDRKKSRLYFNNDPGNFCLIRDEIDIIDDSNQKNENYFTKELFLNTGLEIKLNDRIYINCGNKLSSDFREEKKQPEFKAFVKELQLAEMDVQLEKVKQYYTKYEKEYAHINSIIGVQVCEVV